MHPQPYLDWLHIHVLNRSSVCHKYTSRFQASVYTSLKTLSHVVSRLMYTIYCGPEFDFQEHLAKQYVVSAKDLFIDVLDEPFAHFTSKSS